MDSSVKPTTEFSALTPIIMLNSASEEVICSHGTFGDEILLPGLLNKIYCSEGGLE